VTSRSYLALRLTRGLGIQGEDFHFGIKELL
jgi:hypothetical protein